MLIYRTEEFLTPWATIQKHMVHNYISIRRENISICYSNNLVERSLEIVITFNMNWEVKMALEGLNNKRH